jgi:A/G-specific adenine glycosylase
MRRFRERLLAWGEANRRDLPWRRTRDPWRILVSEVMLQQTQAERVAPHYEGFVAAYSTPSDCAAAGPGEVVRRWSGLGFNRRALNLQRAASSIVDEHGGAVPSEDGSLRALPGVGSYTARAVRSQAFGEDVAAVDTNGIRVLARCLVGAPLTVRDATELADRLVPAGEAWAFTQSLFDLGATLCTARRPRCAECPLRRMCRWRRNGGAQTSGNEAMADPWRASPAARGQSPFAGSERQGRGRLVEALRRGGVRRGEVAAACGWHGDTARAQRVADALVSEGFARWRGGRSGDADPVLCLR